MPRNRFTKEIDTSSLSRKWRRKVQKAPKQPLLETHPVIASQWHPSKNDPLRPDDLTYGSSVRIWWLCPVHPSHVWQTSVSNRCRKGGIQRRGCPFCTGQKACVTNSLKTRFPLIAKEWHPTRNKKKTPENVTAGNKAEAWWRCTQGHEWQAKIVNRTSGLLGCPFCSNKKVCETNSLAFVMPEIAQQWHPTKNGKLTPKDVVPGSKHLVWWRCLKNRRHQWQTRIESRTIEKTGCPFCSGVRASSSNNLAKRFPELAKEWHPTKNGSTTPIDVVPGSHILVWWRCKSNSRHVWKAKLVDRTRVGSGCPVCAETRRGRKVASYNYNLEKLFPEIAMEWHPTENGQLKPSEVTPQSNKKIWWMCRAKNHIWLTAVSARVKGKTGCPYCAGKKVAPDNSLLACFPEITKEWHPSRNGKLTPEQLSPFSHRSVWWQCTNNNERHSWQAPVIYRTKRGRGCPICKENKPCAPKMYQAATK